MPCADGELCLVPANSPKDPDGHGCQGGCGGRLHGICGSIADDENENHRMCSACVVKAGKRKAKAAEGAETGQEQAGKRKAKAAEGAGTGQSKRPNTKGGVLSASRKRLTIQEKVQILQLLDKRTSHEHIADRFNCSERLVRKVKAEREVVEKEAATGGGALKTKRRGDFPEVRHTPLLQHCFFFRVILFVVFCRCFLHNPRSVLPDNAYLSLRKRLHFCGPTLPVIAVATSEVGPAVLLFVEEACQVLRFQTNSVPRYQ